MSMRTHLCSIAFRADYARKGIHPSTAARAEDRSAWTSARPLVSFGVPSPVTAVAFFTARAAEPIARVKVLPFSRGLNSELDLF
jgi:hypothetical protein